MDHNVKLSIECSQFLGELLARDEMERTRPTGCFSPEAFQLLCPEADAVDLLQVCSFFNFMYFLKIYDGDNNVNNTLLHSRFLRTSNSAPSTTTRERYALPIVSMLIRLLCAE